VPRSHLIIASFVQGMRSAVLIPIAAIVAVFVTLPGILQVTASVALSTSPFPGGAAMNWQSAYRVAHEASTHQPRRGPPRTSRPRLSPLPPPQTLSPIVGSPPGEGQWRPVGRVVDGLPAVYETSLQLPDEPGSIAGIAWMDTNLMRATLYSGSISPGGLTWKYTAPVQPAAARTLVAAFNGGFKVPDSDGGYYSEGKLAFSLRSGAASLVIYKNGSATVGEWGRDVSMGPTVVAVRQNLNLLVDHGQPVPGLDRYDTSLWGSTLGGIPNVWRSGLGVTANGALVYIAGPPLTIVDLAELLVRAGSVRAMELDINPYWTTFATYSPTVSTGSAAASNGVDLLPGMDGSPARFFQLS
jgi:hypothetical protein